MARLFLVLVGVVNALIGFSTTVRAQNVSPAVDVATLSPEAAIVYRTWQHYLAAKEGKWSERAGLPSPDWLESEQRRWRTFDLAGYYLIDGATAEISSIERVQSCGAAAYRITTRFRHGDQSLRPPSWWTAVTETVFAVRDGDRWLLANALPHNTCTWRRVTVGAIMYVFAPDYPYNAARARRAVAFVDSLASAFQLPGLDSLTYYLTANVDEMYRIVGLESDLKYGPGPVGGLAQPVNRQLFSGHSAIGEEYRHELAHLILAPLCCMRTSYFVSEGVPTWLGGTAGMDFPTAARGLAAFLGEHPSVSLDSILSGSFPSTQVYPAGGVLTAMVFEQGGIAAVKGLFNAGRTAAELRVALERQLGRAWPTIVHDWRRRVMEFAKPSTDRRFDQRLAAPL